MPPHAAPVSLGTKTFVSVALTLPITLSDLATLSIRVALGALVAGLVNLALDALKRAWRRRKGAAASGSTPPTAPLSAPPPSLPHGVDDELDDLSD